MKSYYISEFEINKTKLIKKIFDTINRTWDK